MEEEKRYNKLENYVEDNHFKDKDLEERYLCGLLDGDGSIYISKLNKDGYSLRVNLTQKNLIIENFCRKYFKFKAIDKRENDPNKPEDYICYQYIIHGEECKNILNIMKKYSIIKYPQTLIALEFIQLIGIEGLSDKREELYRKLQKMNMYQQDHKLIINENKRLNLLSDAYISGIFDAEGTATFGENSFYIQIVQKNFIDIISHIKKYFGYGGVSETYRYRIEDYIGFIDFYRRMCDLVIIKSVDLENLHKYVLSKCHKGLITIEMDPKFNIKNQEDYKIENEINNLPEKFNEYINSLNDDDEKNFMQVYIKQYWKNEVIKKYNNFYIKSNFSIDIDDVCKSIYPDNKSSSRAKQQLLTKIKKIDNHGMFKKSFGGTGGANNEKKFISFNDYSNVSKNIRNQNFCSFINKFEKLIK